MVGVECNFSHQEPSGFLVMELSEKTIFLIFPHKLLFFHIWISTCSGWKAVKLIIQAKYQKKYDLSEMWLSDLKYERKFLYLYLLHYSWFKSNLDGKFLKPLCNIRFSLMELEVIFVIDISNFLCWRNILRQNLNICVMSRQEISLIALSI